MSFWISPPKSAYVDRFEDPLDDEQPARMWSWPLHGRREEYEICTRVGLLSSVFATWVSIFERKHWGSMHYVESRQKQVFPADSQQRRRPSGSAGHTADCFDGRPGCGGRQSTAVL